MSPAFDEMCREARLLGLKIGPIAERPEGTWRVYLQKRDEIMECREGATIEEAFGAVLASVRKQVSPPSFLD